MIRFCRVFLVIASFFVFRYGAFAAVTGVTISNAPANQTFTLINEATREPVQATSNDKGMVAFQIGGWNLPAGSSVRLTGPGLPAGGTVISSLADGLNTRDFDSLGRSAVWPGLGLKLSFHPNVQWRQVPKAGIGTSFPVGTAFGKEGFLLKSRDWLVGFSPEVGVDFNIGNQPFQLGFNYFSANAKTSASEPIGENNVGITFHEMFMGSTGLFLGPTGMDGDIKVDNWSFEFSFGLPALFYNLKREKFDFSIGPRVFIGYDKTNYDGMLQSSTFSGIFSNTNQDVKNTYGGVGLTFQKTHRWPWNLESSGAINLDAVYNDANYNGTQSTFCNLCAPNLTAVKIKTSDRQTNWSFRPSVTAGVDYQWIPNFTVGVRATYQWNSGIPELLNPPNPLKHVPPGLGTTSSQEVKLGVNLRYNF
jgi:hypothetical protein